MKVIGASFPWQRRENGQEALSLAELPFSGMSVTRNLEDSGQGGGFFQPGWSVFSRGAFLRRERY